MKKGLAALLLTGAFIFINCSSQPEWDTVLIEGKISVADSIDSTGDFSGFRVDIAYTKPGTSQVDTLFSYTTKKDGVIKGRVKFPEQGLYPVLISRNGNPIGAIQFILADNDTISFSAVLPDITQSFTVDSREQRAMDDYNRINKNFRRVVAYINAGAVADSAIQDEIAKWSALFWEIKQEHNGTFASNLAARESIRLLSTINKEAMMGALNTSLESERMITVAMDFGLEYVSNKSGVEGGTNYLDSLKRLTKNKDILRLVSQKQIKYNFDSSRVSFARELLTNFKKEFEDDSLAMRWAKIIGYDLNYLAPGFQVPEFSFITQRGDTVNSNSMVGKAYILEITPVASRMYQNQYDRAVVIHQIYRNYNLEILTVPLDESEVTVTAFFEERVKHWPVARLGSFDIKDLIEKFNITDVPTRILVDQSGTIVKKYVAGDFADVLDGLSTIINQKNIGS